MSKLSLPFLAFVAFIFLCFNQSYSQVNLPITNKSKIILNGQGNIESKVLTCLDSTGNIVMANSFFNGNNFDVELNCFSPAGTHYWNSPCSSAISADDEPQSLCITDAGKIILGSNVWNGGSNYDPIVSMHDLQGNLEWQTNIGGSGHEEILNCQEWNNSIVCTYQKISGNNKRVGYAILDNTGSTLQSSLFNNPVMQDIRETIIIQNELFIFGSSTFSGITVVKVNLSTGQVNTPTLSPNGSGMIVSKVEKDGNSLMISGAQYNGTTVLPFVGKYDLNLNQQWISNPQSPGLISVIKKDTFQGEWVVLMDNYTGMNPTGVNLITLDGISGTMNNNFPLKADASARDLTILDTTGYVLSLKDEQQGDVRYANMLVDKQGKLKWMDNQKYVENQEAYPQRIISSDTSLYSAGLTRNTATQEVSYAVIRYDRYERILKAKEDTTNGTRYVEGELIMSFAPIGVDTAFVNNRDVRFGLGSEVLLPSTLSDLQERTGINFSRFNFIKIHKNLTTNDTLSLTRMNELIRIPPFWSDFIVVPPAGFGEAQAIKAHIDTTAGNLVAYTNLNFLAELHCDLNSIINLITTNSWATEYQGITPCNCGSLDDWDNQNGEANICTVRAWSLETGKPHIKCGIFDSGIWQNHPDFDGVNGSVVKEIYDAILDNDMSQYSNEQQDEDSHGTLSAGIIGAVRSNNNIGRPGIAGGDFGLGQEGVSLYGLKIYQFDPSPPPPAIPGSYFITVDHYSQALVETSIDDPTYDISNGEYTFGLHLANSSFGFREGDVQSGEFQEARRAVEFATRNKVTVVASRGNYDNGSYTDPAAQIKNYPACFEGHWVINTGAMSETGDFIDRGNDNYYTSMWNHGVDIIAPGDEGNIGDVPTAFGQTSNYNNYDGTSAAATHVTGTAALLMSYLNDVQPNYINLAPEDIENLIRRGAVTIDNILGKSGANPIPQNLYTDLVGAGGLNAGNTLEEVNKSYRELRHQQTIKVSPTNNLVNNVELLHPVYLEDGTIINPGVYDMNRYEYTWTGNFNLGPNEVVIDAWPRHSSSTFYGDIVNGQLNPTEFIEVVNQDANSITLRGYRYVLNLMGTPPFFQEIPEYGAPIGSFLTPLEMEYSILVENTIAASTEEVEKQDVNIYPNPANVRVEVVWNNIKVEQIEVYDMGGKRVHTVKNIAPSVNKSHISLNTWEKGVYFIILISSDTGMTLTKKIVKL